MLVLDALGKVTAANASARTLWQTGDNELIGEALPTLFVSEITSSDPEFLEVQWEVLLESALNRSTTLQAMPREGAPREVRLRLEAIFGPAAGYIATVQPPAAAATPSS